MHVCMHVHVHAYVPVYTVYLIYTKDEESTAWVEDTPTGIAGAFIRHADAFQAPRSTSTSNHCLNLRLGGCAQRTHTRTHTDTHTHTQRHSGTAAYPTCSSESPDVRILRLSFSLGNRTWQLTRLESRNLLALPGGQRLRLHRTARLHHDEHVLGVNWS